MKIILRSILICIPLTACFDDSVNPIEAKIDYPPLAAQDNFDVLREKSIAEVSDVDTAKTIMAELLARLMNVVEIANQMADEVAEGVSPDPLYKTRARGFKIIDARSEFCSNAEGQNVQTESLIQNDVDNDGSPSVGDEWSYIWEGCENSSNNSTVTGVMSFTGMSDPLDELNSSIEIETFTNYQYSFDLQIDSLNSKSVFLQQVKFLYSRDEDDVTTLKISPESIMGVISGSELYVFSINSATLVSDDNAGTLELNIDARYFDSAGGIAGYVDIVTIEKLLFEYDLNLTNRLNVTRLQSGSLDVISQNESRSNLFVNSSEDKKLKISVIDVDGDTQAIDQAEFFDTGSFALVNLTGLSN